MVMMMMIHKVLNFMIYDGDVDGDDDDDDGDY